MSPAWLWPAAAVCALIAVALRMTGRTEADEPKVRGAIATAATVAAYLLALAAFLIMGETMSPAARIGSSAATGAVVMLLAFSEKPRKWTLGTIVWKLLWSVYVATFVFSWASPGGYEYTGPVLLLMGAVFLIESVRNLVVHWNDEDTLLDRYGTQGGYIQRRETMPVRAKAILTLVLTALLLAFGAWLVVTPLYQPPVAP